MGRHPKVAATGRVVRHPPSRELWQFCLAALRLVRGPEEDDRALTTITGISSFYLSRWRHGQMYMDRAEHLVRMADALDVDIKLLIDLACGTINANAALRIHLQDPAAAVRGEQMLGAPLGGAIGKPGRRPLLLVISGNSEHRVPVIAALQQFANATGIIADTLSAGLVAAERYRPQITFLDLAVSPMLSLEACRTISRLGCGSRRQCRVVVGIPTITDAAVVPALMAGAAAAYTTPFREDGFLAELGKLLSPPSTKKVPHVRDAAATDDLVRAT